MVNGMKRNIALALISVLNGVCIFLICSRLWCLDRPEIPTPVQSVSIVLTLKILYNILCNTSLSIHCMWNSLLLLFYCVFVYTADHFEEYKRSKYVHYETIFGFQKSVPRSDAHKPIWTDFKFIASCVFLLLSLYRPVSGPSDEDAAIDEEVMRKYRTILLRKLIKRRANSASDVKVGTDWGVNDGSKVTRTTSCTTLSGTYSPDSGDHTSEETIQKADVDDECSVRCDGTGDCVPSVVHSHFHSMITQTETDIHVGKSMGIQCARLLRQESVLTKLVGPSRHNCRTYTTKSTNTSQYVLYSKRIKARPKNAYILRAKVSKQLHDGRDDRKDDVRRIVVNRRKSIQLVSPADSNISPGKIMQPRSRDSGIFNLDDLINAQYSRSSRNEKIRQRSGLDEIPTKDVFEGEDDNTLNVLYITDKMHNSTQGIQHSEDDIEFIREYHRCCRI